MKFVAPVEGFLFQQRLDLADGRLAQINDIHEGRSGAFSLCASLSYPNQKNRCLSEADRAFP
jgi:hypothetical protein